MRFLSHSFFQRTEERFGHHIIPAVATSAHARGQVIGPTEAPPVVTVVLAALIAMHDDLVSPTRIAELLRDLENMGQMVKLPGRRERAFPLVVKEIPWKYPKADKKIRLFLSAIRSVTGRKRHRISRIAKFFQ